ncbi:MAG: dihydrofolate reductase [Bacteriovoracia bacterium]
MKISIIVAVGKNHVIGKNNQLLWHLKDDFKKFKEVTMSHHLIMGRKTFESIGKPLPGRTTIVLTTKCDWDYPNVLKAHSLKHALDIAKNSGEDEVFICGGASVYEEAMPVADRFYLTEVCYQGDGDAFFPRWNRKNWKIVEEFDHPKDERNEFAWTFKLMERK